MFCTAALLLALRPEGDLSQKITLEGRGITGIQLTDRLSRMSQLHFEASDEAARDVFILHVDQVPLQDVMAKIADVAQADWLPLGDGSFRLHRSAVKVAAARADSQKAMLARISATFAKYRKELASAPDFTEEQAHKIAHDMRRMGPPPQGMMFNSSYWEKQNKIQNSLPAGRAFERILLNFPLETFANLPLRQRVVFSSSPTAMQYPLPEGALQSLSSFVAEQETWSEAVAKYLPGQDNMNYGSVSGQAAKKITGAIVAFNQYQSGSAPQAEVKMFDAKGRILDQTYIGLEDYSAFNLDPTPPKAPKEPMIPIGTTDTELAQLYSYYGQGGGPKFTDPAKIREIVLHPEKHNPQSYFASTALIGTAKQRHENLVALLPDSSGYFAYFISKKGFDPTLLRSRVFQGEVKLTDGDGWLTLSPSDMVSAEKARVDPTALATLLKEFDEKGRLSIDALSDFALTSEDFDQNATVRAYLEGIQKGGSSALNENDKNTLRFYGSLDARQKQGGRIRLGALNSDQLAIITKMVFGEYSRLSYSYTQEDYQAMQSNNGEDNNVFWGTIYQQEPTCALANGIPPNGYVDIKPSDGDVIMAHMMYGEYDGGFQAQSPDGVAWSMVQGEQSGYQRVVGLGAAQQKKITFDFKFTAKLGQTMELSDTKQTMKETPFVEKLPDSLRKKLQDAIAQVKKQMSDGQISFGGYYDGGSSAPPR